MGITSKQRGRHLFGDIGFTPGGNSQMKFAKVTFDPTANAAQRAIAAHALGTLPNGAVVVGGFIVVNTTFTSNGADAGTIAISVEGANDIKAAIAIADVTNPWDAGKQAIIPKANTPETTSVTLSAERSITATVAAQTLLGGKATIYLLYV